MVEIAVTPAAQPVEDMLAELPGDTDPQTRLLRLVDTFNGSVIEQEAPMRTALRVYLDTWLDNRRKADGSAPVREGRRMRWLEEVLAPARGELTAAQWKRLQAALALTLSIEPIVVMKDVCRLEDKEALAVLRWAAKALLHAALAEARAAAAQRRNKAA